MFFLAYKVGGLILEVPVQELQFELSFHWIGTRLAAIWQPFLLGCLICGLVSGSLGYFVISMAWRWRVVKLWRERSRKRAEREQADSTEI
ncbi:MAG: DUF2062 domain-containing protein, partial [Pseudomonadota bacterium]